MANIIYIEGSPYELIYPRESIKEKIAETAIQISKDYASKKEPPILLTVLTGGLYSGVDLSRELGKLEFRHEIACISIKSYKQNKQISKPKINCKPTIELKGRDVIVVEDILDSGDTMNCLDKYLRTSYFPKSIRYFILCTKPEHNFKRKVHYEILRIKNFWAVGMGMDTNKLGREEEGIYAKI